METVLRSPVLNCPPLLTGLILIVGCLLPFVVISYMILPTFEGWTFTYIFVVALFGLYVGLVLAFLQFLSLWICFHRWLRRFALHPLVEAYSRLPLRTAQTLGKFDARL